MKNKSIFSVLLVLCLLLALLPAPVYAAQMTASDSLLEYLKACEGFTKYAYWDYQHYTIGYGTSCTKDQYPDGITEAEAERDLRDVVAYAEESVNSFVKKNNMTPTQNQFDSMVSLTYALGASWMGSSYNLPKLFARGNAGELELLNCMGDWVNAGGQTLNGLIYRRMSETYIYFHGVYRRFTGGMDDCPYACLKLDADGGTVSPSRIYTFMGAGYGTGEPLPVPTKSGYQFTGWYDGNGSQIKDDAPADAMLKTVYARWVPAPTRFSDVFENDWFCGDVLEASEQGLFAGYTDGSFRPRDNMTRAMFAQVLYRLAGEPECSQALPFSDVAPTAWYAKAVRWAYQEGIVNGVAEDCFAPTKQITREQMATMLFKYSARHGATDASGHSSLEGFRDAGSISNYALEPMQWAVGNGLIHGVSDNQLSPKSNATRAQAAAILVRLSGILMQGIA